MTGWSSRIISIADLTPARCMDAKSYEVQADAAKNEFKNLRINATVPVTDVTGCAPRRQMRNYVRICAYGSMGFWICAVCIKIGRDFRLDFCPFTVMT